MNVVLLTRQIGHYHNARFAAAKAQLGTFAVLSLEREGPFAEFLSVNIGGYEVEYLYQLRSQYRAAVAAGQVRRSVSAALDRRRPDILVIAGWASAESAAAILWARRHARPIIVMSETQAIDARRIWYREFVKSVVVRQCDAALVGAEPHRDYLVQLGMAREKIFLGYDAVDNAYFDVKSREARADAAILRRKLDLPDAYVLASARFIAKKNLFSLLEAYDRAIAQCGGGPDLVILGDGELRGALEDRARQLKTSAQIHMPGFRGYGDLPAYYGLAKGFVHVSRVEQWGLVINEAMACSLPIVVSHTCGAANLIDHGEQGFKVDPCDVESICAGLAAMFRLSAEAREEMGSKARARISNWGTERFGSGLTEAVRCCAARRSDGDFLGIKTLLLKVLSQSILSLVS